MNRLSSVTNDNDIFEKYKNTPIESLLGYQNLNRPYESYSKAQLLVGMCMDNRKHLKIPDNFAYIIRSGGGNLRHSEFKVSYAISIGGVKAIALMAHNNCGMVNLASKKEKFIEGLIEAGWDKNYAEDHFTHLAPLYEIGNEIDFVLSEAARIRMRYPNILVAPLFYNVDDNKLYLVNEK